MRRLVSIRHTLNAVQEFKVLPIVTDWDPYAGISVADHRFEA